MVAIAYKETNSLTSFTPPMVESIIEPKQKYNEMIIVENKLGTFEFIPEKLIYFPNGLLGFAEFTAFGLTSLPNGESTDFRLLQSVENAELSFIVYPTTFETSLLNNDDVKALCSQFNIAYEQLVLMHIVTIREQAGKRIISLNLKAPLILDVGKQSAIQHVLLNDNYSVKHIIATI
jgi:flagellar assembly factor FliW